MCSPEMAGAAASSTVVDVVLVFQCQSLLILAVLVLAVIGCHTFSAHAQPNQPNPNHNTQQHTNHSCF